ncbi:hypothetical protein BGZ50_001906, partial [Haplosporangium sp. Z 11]
MDVFRDLFRALYDKLLDSLLTHAATLDSVLDSIVEKELQSVQDHLIALDYPNFSSESNFRLVVDEAQALNDRGTAKFESSSAPAILRPMLSPVLKGFRGEIDRRRITTIYCGTGLSIKTLHW